jgi:hypothetical protein
LEVVVECCGWVVIGFVCHNLIGFTQPLPRESLVHGDRGPCVIRICGCGGTGQAHRQDRRASRG